MCRRLASAFLLALAASSAIAQAPSEPKRTPIPSWIPEFRGDAQRYVPAPERTSGTQPGDAPRVVVISPEGCTDPRCSDRRFEPPRTIEFQTPSMLQPSDYDRAR